MTEQNTAGPADRLVSYSINSEDVLLRRVFAGRTTGFFVDVGAEHPVNGNDFFGLYLLGWRGINIEPNPFYFAQLQEKRPEDLNLQRLVSDVPARALPFFIIEQTGLSTCDAEQAEIQAGHGAVVHRVEMDAATLTQILDEAKPPHIDVLKIDVEGFEEQVLRGNDWTRYRPSLIMLEATLPQSPVRRETGIREFLETVGYDFVHHDGLNDFFVEKTFVLPPDSLRAPDVFDNIVRWDMVALRNTYDELHDQFLDVEHYAKTLEGERDIMGRTLSGTSQMLEEKRRSEQLLSAVLDKTSQVAISLLANDFEKVDMILSESGLMPVQRHETGQPDAGETGRELVVVETAQHTPDDGDGHPLSEIQIRMMQARLLSLQRERSRQDELIKDLQFENRRLAAGNEQLQGERLALNRALDQMRPQAQILTDARLALAEMQRLIDDRTVEQTERAREVAARVEQANAEAARIERANEEVAEREAERNEEARLQRVARRYGKPDSAGSDDALMLKALYSSTSWKMTRPIRALGSLIRPRKDDPAL